MNFIGECGHPVTDHAAKLCRACYLANVRRVCAKCGRRRGIGSRTLCRECWREDTQKNFCQDCGCQVTKAETKRCMVCHLARIRDKTPEYRCVDCGVPFAYKPSRGSWDGKHRCRTCSDRYRRERPKPRCSVEGCLYPVRARGLCWNHYKKAVYRSRIGEAGRGALTKKEVGEQPCALCGFHQEGYHCHVHRVVPELGYADGNRVPLCGTCHELCHRGLATLPDIRL